MNDSYYLNRYDLAPVIGLTGMGTALASPFIGLIPSLSAVSGAALGSALAPNSPIGSISGGTLGGFLGGVSHNLKYLPFEWKNLPKLTTVKTLAMHSLPAALGGALIGSLPPLAKAITSRKYKD